MLVIFDLQVSRCSNWCYMLVRNVSLTSWRESMKYSGGEIQYLVAALGSNKRLLQKGYYNNQLVGLGDVEI